MKRREFIQLTAANAVWFGIGALPENVVPFWPSSTPVAIDAELGTFFPALVLAERMIQNEHLSTAFLVSQENEGSHAKNQGSQSIDIAFRLPEVPKPEGEGMLRDDVRKLLVRKISAFLNEQFGYRVVETKVGSTGSFWYPFWGDSSNLIFCRLTVTKRSERLI
jgi:hypothetical protein